MRLQTRGCSTLAQVGLIDDVIDIVWRYVTIVWIMKCEVAACNEFAECYTDDEHYLCRKHSALIEPVSFVRITNLAHGQDTVWEGFNQAEWVLRFWLKQSFNSHVAFAHKHLVQWGGVEERIWIANKSRKSRKPPKPPELIPLTQRKPWR